MKKDEIKKIMIESLKLAKECRNEVNLHSADEVLTGIIAVKIFDSLSKYEDDD